MSRKDEIKAFVLTLLILTHLVTGRAQGEDPAAAARAIGQAGQATAGAIAKDADSAAHVPGYAGTNLPERGLGPDAPVGTDDPIARRGDGIQGDAHSPSGARTGSRPDR